MNQLENEKASQINYLYGKSRNEFWREMRNSRKRKNSVNIDINELRLSFEKLFNEKHMATNNEFNQKMKSKIEEYENKIRQEIEID
jgi:hypothetical protein